LFFHQVGKTTFDVPAPTPYNESNILNLVVDAERDALNTFTADPTNDPVRMVINANGAVRDAIQKGASGKISIEDLFRVLPLGLSPVEKTPNYPLVDFYLVAPELKAALEVGVNQGLQSDSFWLGVSGARIEYDLSRPAFDPAHPTDFTKGRITKITLTAKTATAGADHNLEATPIFDVTAGNPFPQGAVTPIHLGTSMYIGLFAEALGVCPRDKTGAQNPVCKACTTQAQCQGGPAPICAVSAGRCVGGPPAAFTIRSMGPMSLQPLGPMFPTKEAPNGYITYPEELKEVFALQLFVQKQPNGGTLPMNYNAPVPRRLCCTGSMCGTGRTCAQ
jgi:hypothetical protein